MGTRRAGTPPGSPEKFAPQRSPEHPGTSHMSIVDNRGEVVSMTTTVEAPMGSEMMAMGFILDNQLTDFSFDPVRDGKPVANAPAPGKRPLSAMSPTIVLGADGNSNSPPVRPAGSLIIDYVAQSLIAMLDAGISPAAAAALPHAANLNTPDLLEKGTALEALAPATHRDGPHGRDARRREERPQHRRAHAERLHRRQRSTPRRRGAGGLIFVFASPPTSYGHHYVPHSKLCKNRRESPWDLLRKLSQR